MSTIKGRMSNYIGISASKKYLGVNYEDDAKEAYAYIYPSRYEEYVDPDLYSPLLYRTWGELLKKKGVIESYEIIVKAYRYVIRVQYTYMQNTEYEILGSDGLMSVGKCADSIEQHKYIGGFALWPSHSGGINFRKNRYKDDIFKTLYDIEMFYKNPKEYSGVIPEKDYKWFSHLGENGGFMDIFFFSAYEKYNDLLDFEKYRTAEMIKFLEDEGANIIGNKVIVKVDRPMGSYHPKHKDMYYPVNYGYIESIIAPDGEEQDAYILGVNGPIEEFSGVVIAIIHRFDDVEEKWVVAPENVNFTVEEIEKQVHFQEQYFQSEIRM